MEPFFALLALAIVGFVIVGPILGILAFNQSRRTSRELARLILSVRNIEGKLESVFSHGRNA